MAKKEKPKAGRFIHLEFPPQGTPSIDTIFHVCYMHALLVPCLTDSKVKVSYTGMKEEESMRKCRKRIVLSVS